ncbi:hypothetical protein [Parachryseolinea silvisoli]|uniref:hypothetical protein n=1 Tax=Parachryseolinea silvisoli TaxID=2873601 RepID=UPI002265E9F3|nr:hypothetical protein [Parachryseolinea silvisoli]MCD9014425.1 hypothetical protein [Parachryseolinea silvisoli]
MRAKYNLRYFARQACHSRLAALFALTIAASCGPHSEQPVTARKAAKQDSASVQAGNFMRDHQVVLQKEKLSQLTTELNVQPVKEKMLLVIPTHGCGSCIEAALKYTSRHDEREKLTTVVSGTSKRYYTLAAHKFGIDTAKIIFDKETRPNRYGLITLYPTLFQVTPDGTIVATDLDSGNLPKVFADAGLTVQ